MWWIEVLTFWTSKCTHHVQSYWSIRCATSPVQHHCPLKSLVMVKVSEPGIEFIYWHRFVNCMVSTLCFISDLSVISTINRAIAAGSSKRWIANEKQRKLTSSQTYKFSVDFESDFLIHLLFCCCCRCGCCDRCWCLYWLNTGCAIRTSACWTFCKWKFFGRPSNGTSLYRCPLGIVVFSVLWLELDDAFFINLSTRKQSALKISKNLYGNGMNYRTYTWRYSDVGEFSSIMMLCRFARPHAADRENADEDPEDDDALKFKWIKINNGFTALYECIEFSIDLRFGWFTFRA